MTRSSDLCELTTRKHDDESVADLDERAPRPARECSEDLRLAERITRDLHATGYSVLRSIEVVVAARIVRLVGRVPSYHMKQIAQVTALAVPGAHQIHNDLHVLPPN